MMRRMFQKCAHCVSKWSRGARAYRFAAQGRGAFGTKSVEADINRAREPATTTTAKDTK